MTTQNSNVPSQRITVTCSCGKRLVVSSKHAGKRTKCPECSEPLVIPRGASLPLGDSSQTANEAEGGRNIAFVAMWSFLGVFALACVSYVTWDISSTAERNRLTSEILELSDRAEQHRSQNELREALNCFELLISKGSGISDEQIRRKVNVAERHRDELREILKVEWAQEEEERQRQEQLKRKQDDEQQPISQLRGTWREESSYFLGSPLDEPFQSSWTFDDSSTVRIVTPGIGTRAFSVRFLPNQQFQFVQSNGYVGFSGNWRLRDGSLIVHFNAGNELPDISAAVSDVEVQMIMKR